MRGIKNYTLKEWLRLDPPIWYLKEKRNEAVSGKFVNTRPDTLRPFLENHDYLRGTSIAVVVAFNSPWVIEVLLPALKRFILDAEIIVCDNSNKPELRPEIEDACAAENIPYFSLPKNPEKHPCRSHGISLNWIYHNLLRNFEPNMFACLDHDLIPFKEVRLTELLGTQPVYGLRKTSPWSWFLWAGYCMFSYSAVKDKAVDFNNDRPNILDTGGQNWKPIYRHLDVDHMKFASGGTYTIQHPDGVQTLKGHVLDNAWLHLAGVGKTKGRKDRFSERAMFYSDVFNEVKKGRPLVEFITPCPKTLPLKTSD